MLRIRNKMHPEISTEQYGFMKDKRIKNAIFVLRMLSERAIQMQQKMHLCFIDWKKAFDSVNHEKLLQLLNKIGIDSKDLRLIQALYYEQTANVKIVNDVPGNTQIKKGVRHGCVLPPDLFDLCSEIILRGINDFEEIKVNGININNIRYADDTVLISTSPRELQKMLNELEKIGEQYGMSIDVSKTECLVVTKLERVPRLTLFLKGNSIKQTEHLRCLGSLISSNGRSTNEIKRRIVLAKQAFIDLGYILRNKKMSFRIRFRLLKCYVWSVFLYGCESWTNWANQTKLSRKSTHRSFGFYGECKAFHGLLTLPMKLF